MFSLIVTIISIALVAALAIAGLYYGGTAFTQGAAKAAASTVVAQAQQISAANTLYANDNGGANAASASALAPDYLASVPQLPTTISADGSLTLNSTDASITGTVANQQVCDAIDKQVGLVIDNTTDATSGGTIAASTIVTAQYGCYFDGTSYQFLFK